MNAVAILLLRLLRMPAPLQESQGSPPAQAPRRKASAVQSSSPHTVAGSPQSCAFAKFRHHRKTKIVTPTSSHTYLKLARLPRAPGKSRMSIG